MGLRARIVPDHHAILVGALQTRQGTLPAQPLRRLTEHRLRKPGLEILGECGGVGRSALNLLPRGPLDGVRPQAVPHQIKLRLLAFDGRHLGLRLGELFLPPALWVVQVDAHRHPGQSLDIPAQELVLHAWGERQAGEQEGPRLERIAPRALRLLRPSRQNLEALDLPGSPLHSFRLQSELLGGEDSLQRLVHRIRVAEVAVQRAQLNPQPIRQRLPVEGGAAEGLKREPHLRDHRLPDEPLGHIFKRLIERTQNVVRVVADRQVRESVGQPANGQALVEPCQPLLDAGDIHPQPQQLRLKTDAPQRNPRLLSSFLERLELLFNELRPRLVRRQRQIGVGVLPPRPVLRAGRLIERLQVASHRLADLLHLLAVGHVESQRGERSVQADGTDLRLEAGQIRADVTQGVQQPFVAGLLDGLEHLVTLPIPELLRQRHLTQAAHHAINRRRRLLSQRNGHQIAHDGLCRLWLDAVRRQERAEVLRRLLDRSVAQPAEETQHDLTVFLWRHARS